MKLKQPMISICLAALVLIACEKKEIKGPQGDPGTPGTGGNSNLSHSDAFVVNSTQWSTDSDSIVWQSSYSSTLITQTAFDRGAVRVYMQKGTAWSELPYIDGDIITQFGFQAGSIKLMYSDMHENKLERPSDAYYRIVVHSQSGKPQSSPGDSFVTGGNLENKID